MWREPAEGSGPTGALPAPSRRVGGLAPALLTLLVLALLARPARALEYRLQVVSLYEEALSSGLRSSDLVDGASGPGLERLEGRLDAGTFPVGAILWDRPPRAADPALARAYRAVAVRAEGPEAGERRLWHELRWQGRPGDQTVWMVSPDDAEAPETDLGR